MKIETVKDVEFYIRRAMATDRALPKVGQKPYSSPLGRWQTSEDFMMSINDQLEESELEGRKNDLIYDPSEVDDWWTVMVEWLPKLPAGVRTLVIVRCCNAGWKSVVSANEEFLRNGNEATYFDSLVRKAKRYFSEAMDTILKMSRNVPK